MEYEKRIWAIVGALIAVVALFLLFGRACEELLPEPRAVRVAIQAADSETARTGVVTAPAGSPYRLHAVLVADDWRGEPVYYTEAPRLEVDGVEIAPQAIRRWDRPGEVRVLWFNLLGQRPYLEVSSVPELEEFAFREVYRPDWPQVWSIPGTSAPRAAERRPVFIEADALPFGTRRFHVRVEIFGPASDIVPRHRFRSPGAAEVLASPGEVSTLVMSLAGSLETPSTVFGLAQIEPVGDRARELLPVLARWTREGLGFSRLAMFRRMLDDLGIDLEALEWSRVETDGSADWGGGDLLRVGERWVLTYEDRGRPNAIDDEDLCLDFDKGATVRRLGDIFTGDGLVEVARVGR